jgi:arabinogalactan oligomer / maltooligosaccharide transport system substrate-binding protein
VLEDGRIVSVMTDSMGEEPEPRAARTAKNEKKSGFLDKPRLGGKSFWNWANMASKLAIPVILGVAALWFGSQQAKNAQNQQQAQARSAQDQQQATILQTYIGNMQDLLLKYKMPTSKPGDEVRLVAKEQTVATLQRLNAQRNEIVLQFLRANLGVIDQGVIDLSGADLSGADLSGVDLSGANLSGATMNGADLSGATLAGAYLNYAILTDANLTGAHLSNANFSDADLTDARMNDATLDEAHLNSADLSGATLSGATLSSADLNSALLKNANLSGATLRNAILTSATLTNATMRGADLTSADLTGAIDPPVSAQPRLDEAHSCLPLSDVLRYDPLLTLTTDTGLICPPSPPPIRLTYWYTESGPESKVIKQLVGQFNQCHPGIYIKAMPVSFFQAQTGFITAVRNDEAPDILRSDIGWVTQFASQGYLLNIDSYIRQSGLDLSDYQQVNPPVGLNPELNAPGTTFSPLAYDEYNGHLYGLPQVTDVLALLYNMKEFHAAGITSPPSTMAALEQDAEKVVQYDRGKPGSPLQYGFETNGESYYALPFLYAYGGGMFDQNNNIVVDSKRSVQGLEFLVYLQNNPDQVMPPVDYSTGISNNGISDMTTDFANGKTAMIFDGPFDVKDILGGPAFNGKHESAFNGNNGNLGIASIPMGPHGHTGSPLGGQSYVISASTKYPHEAYEFIKFMSSESSQVAIAEKNYTLPTLASAYNDSVVSSNSFIKQFHRIWEEEAVARPAIPAGGYLFDEFDPSVWAALDGVESPSNALQAVADSWYQLGVQNQLP